MVDTRRSFSFTSEVEFTDRPVTSWFGRLKRFLWSDWEGYHENIRMEHQQGNSVSLEGVNVLPGFSNYDDFHTIDWLRDITRDRRRHRYLQIRKVKSSGSSGTCTFLCDAFTAWLCVSIVGVLCGCVAAFIDIGTTWMIDLKEGYCEYGFWFNRDQCCWSSNTSFFIEDDCDEWTTWAELFGISEATSELYYWIQYLMFVVFGLLMAVLAALFVRTFAPYAGGGGIPELKTVLSGFIIRGLLGKWTMFIKMVGVMLAVASGLVLGKEGPMVHIACCIGNIIARLFPKYKRNEAKKREILSASAAAGVSVAFGAPIGGVLFSLEEVSYYFPLKTLWRTFFCALVAVFVLNAINPFGNDHSIVFYVEYTTPWIFVEIFPFLLIGALGGFFASVFIKANIFLSRLRKNTCVGQYPVAEVIVITLITVLVSFPNQYMRADSNQLIALLVRDCRNGHHYDLCDYVQSNLTNGTAFQEIEAGPGIARACWQLIIAFVVKFVLLVMTVGIKVPAGLYIPCLAIGAIMGRLIGIAMEQLVSLNPDSIIFQGACGIECVTPGLYAIVGAGAFLAGVTRMTVGLVVIMFEVTGGVRYIIPLMLSVVMSKWVADALSPRGIFEALIHLNDYPFLDAKEEYSADISVASDVMEPKNNEEFIILTQTGMTVGQIEKITIESTFNGFPVVDSMQDKFLVGFVLRRDLILALNHAKKIYPVVDANLRVCFSDEDFDDIEDANGVWLRKIVDMACVTVNDVTSTATVTDMFKKLGLRQLLVTKKGKLMGIITKKDLLRHLQRVE